MTIVPRHPRKEVAGSIRDKTKIDSRLKMSGMTRVLVEMELTDHTCGACTWGRKGIPDDQCQE